MASKTISVTEDVYNLLKKMKLPKESFGDTIARLCKGKTSKSLHLWALSSQGWSDLTESETEILEETLQESQSSFHEERVDLA